MAIVQCERQHYYDNEKFSECPHCARQKEMGDPEDESVTVALARESRQVEDYAMEYLKKSTPKVHIAMEEDSEKTVSIYQKKGVSRCVAGWLVCTEGEEYGQGFPLYAGFNRIGRAHSNDIVLKDPQVSREEHCSIVYEDKKNVFYLFPKDGNLVYLGEEMVQQAQEIGSGQVITIGGTQFVFVPFCIGERKWTKKE